MTAPIEVEDWGLVPYGEALERQRAKAAARARGEIGDALVLVEHPGVVTLGRGADRRDVLDARFPVFEVERGGEATWHGPGQLVGYLIRALPPGARDLRAHLRSIEDLLIRAAARLGVAARREDGGPAGVWVGDAAAPRKIASIGVAARNWVTFHGFALNVSVDLGGFRSTRPCGLDPSAMTSLQEVLCRAVSISEAKNAVVSEI